MTVENELKRLLNNLLEYNINKLVDFYKIELYNMVTKQRYKQNLNS